MVYNEHIFKKGYENINLKEKLDRSFTEIHVKFHG